MATEKVSLLRIVPVAEAPAGKVALGSTLVNVTVKVSSASTLVSLTVETLKVAVWPAGPAGMLTTPAVTWV